MAKCDTYVVETNVHFPTDVTLLWDAARKTIDIASSLAGKFGLGGWRKHKSLRKELKGRMRNLGRIASRGGADKPQRLANEAEAYLEKARALSGKAAGTVADLQAVISDLPDTFRLEELLYYSGMLDKHIDLVGRRLVNGEKIPHGEKVFSLFEPHTLWISKGKAGCPVELGRKLLVTTDQHHLVLDYAVLDTADDHPAAPETIVRIMERYVDTPIKSISFDKGFSSKSNRERLMEVGARVIMPAKGKPTAEQRAEEAEKKYVRLRHAHSAVESNINSLEHHGLDRCRDKGIDGYLRCVGLGVLAYNLHQIGKGLMRRDRDAAQPAARRRGAPECRAAA